jgi:hypothetical protein
VPTSQTGDAVAAAVTSFVAAVLDGLYEGNVRYKSKPVSKVKLEQLVLVMPAGDAQAAVLAADKGVALARGTLTARWGWVLV